MLQVVCRYEQGKTEILPIVCNQTRAIEKLQEKANKIAVFFMV